MAGDSHLGRAALLGLGGGLRSFAAPVALAVHDRGPLSGSARPLAFAGAAGEVVADKLPSMPSRWSAPGLAPRLAFSGEGGRQLAGLPGAGVAAAAAVASAYAGSRLRGKVPRGSRQLSAAVAEDVLSYALVLTATRGLE
ncbi:MAG TPA: hypothetical protein VGH67_20305 [Solirubrobacteraceae bacterium]|jgi:uncharacterized membrane protein